MNLVFDIAPDGTVTCLHTEALPLESLGPLSIKRASTIEFNDASQEWEVRIPDTLCPTAAPVVFSDKSRQRCLEWEREEINHRLLNE